MNAKIPLFKMYSDQEEIKAVTKVISRNSNWAVGKEVEDFESEVANYLGIKYALSFNSGTSALHTLLLAHHIKGKEVIVPSFTFIATVNTVLLAEGIPIFAESESETFGLDIDDVKKRITENTKAIIALHYAGGVSKDIEELRKLTQEKGILLIEDAAESMGATLNEKMVGTFGDSAILSFCQNKIISTGEGGMIVTNSKEIYEKAKLIRSHGRDEKSQDYFSSTQDNDYIDLGYNFRMPSMNAALGRAQLQKINKIINIRREKAQHYTHELSDIKQLSIPLEKEGQVSVYQMYTIVLGDKNLRDKLQQHLSEKDIMTKIYFNPVHLKSYYKRKYGCEQGRLPNTEKLSDRVLTLPFYTSLKKDEMDYIINSIKEFFKNES